ncbi:MAG: choice-of-anchor tandem repeat GloVer-containing protein [Verrucomicrobiota bacterium]
MKKLLSVFLAVLGLSAAATSQPVLTTLISFTGTNGANPQAGLTLGNDGNFYGTTSVGGSHDFGTVFRVTTNGELTSLYSFSINNDGIWPYAGLTLGKDGNFYGTASLTGETGEGSIFKVTTNGTLTSLVAFNGTNGGDPYAGLTLGKDGNLYGTTVYGGDPLPVGFIGGTMFKVTTNGVLTTLVTFETTNGDGDNPYGGVTQGNDGCFYGTTSHVGNGGNGTLFRVTTNGSLTTLLAFGGTNGGWPQASLTLANDGNFYGTTCQGGSSGDGTVFKVTTGGVLTSLVSFNGTNGSGPGLGSLTLGSDGSFYGTTYGGGVTGQGTVFRITTNGVLSTLVSFNGTNGRSPDGALTLGNDCNFYGTTYPGGSSNLGTVFKLTLTAPAVSLGIMTLRNLPMVLYPLSATNSVLQMTTNLATGYWVNVTNGVQVTLTNGASSFGVQITNAPTSAFFRLQSQQ